VRSQFVIEFYLLHIELFKVVVIVLHAAGNVIC